MSSREIVSVAVGRIPSARDLEIDQLQVGQAGNQIGEAFWSMLLAEHGLDPQGVYHGTNPLELDRITTYFEEIEPRAGIPARYVPRSTQVDLEGGVLKSLRSGLLGQLFPPDSWIHGEPGAGNNWARGFYTEGAELVDQLLDYIRRQTEKCESLQGYQLFHSLGGGTGSGLGTLLLNKLREEEPDRMLATFSIMPSPKVSETVVEPYNTMLSLHQLTESTDLTFCIDNEALFDINQRQLKIANPGFKDLNRVIARVMCGISTTLRFPGQLNGDLRKLAMNLIPFPRLHYVLPSYGPLVATGHAAYQGSTVNELVGSLFDRHNLLVACDPRYGRYLTAATIFRGQLSAQEVEIAVEQLQSKNSSSFVDWIPDNVSITMCSVPPVGQKHAGVCLANSTSIQEMWKRTLNQFAPMFKRRAFLHGYCQEGMDEMEFTEAQSNVEDLITEYQQYQEDAGDDHAEMPDYEGEDPSEY